MPETPGQTPKHPDNPGIPDADSPPAGHPAPDLPDLATIQASLRINLAAANQRLDNLRDERDRLGASIRAAVAERDEIASILARVTPRQPKPKPKTTK